MTTMAAIVSRRNREVGLAMPALVATDDESSPHLNTLQQLASEKAGKPELQLQGPAAPVNGNDEDIEPGYDYDDSIAGAGLDDCKESNRKHMSDGELVGSVSGDDEDSRPGHDIKNSVAGLDNGIESKPKDAIGGEVDESVESDEAHDLEATTTRSLSSDERVNYIPAHLNDASSKAANHPAKYDGGTEEDESPRPEGTGLNDQVGISISEEIDEAGEATGVQPTPTGCFHTRIPSSSIPHLLSASNSFTADPQQLIEIQQQLNPFIGIASASPSVRSRDDSFAFSIDGDDSAYKKVTPSPQVVPIIHPQAHIVMNLRPGVGSPIEGAGSNFSSSLSLCSFVSPSHIQSTNITPTNAPNIMSSPPPKVSLVEPDINMPSLSAQPLLAAPTDKASPYKPSQAVESNLEQGNASLTKGQCTTAYGMIRPKHALPNQYPVSSNVQPVLYSAINSLEKYNAGSFDNKIILAKARGRNDRQKAFPGVPGIKSDRLPDGTSKVEEFVGPVDSGLDSKSSSDVSAPLAGGSSIQKGGATKQNAADNASAKVKQTGVGEHFVPLKRQPSERFIKSKSSGNLSENPKSLEELKALRRKDKGNLSVTIVDQKPAPRKGRRKEKKVGVFRPSSDAYTPRMGNRAIKYKPAKERASVDKMSSTMGTIQRPNFRDALRRVSIILHQHIVKIELRFSTGIRGVDDTGLFKANMKEAFHEENFATPRYKCAMVRVPMARPGVVYSMRKIRVVHTTPTTDEIYDFAHQLFKKVQLSSECSIVCLIYVEKLMEVAKVPLVAETWRPIFMCGLLLASKVWQDLSSWNIEFASVYPQFSLDAINRLELSFLKYIKWDLYISSSLYAKYYFALRSLLEKSGFRDRYNQMVGGIGGIAASEALKVSKRSEAVKEEALLQLSRSM